MNKRQFIQYLRKRHENGETLAEIGKSLGVTHSAVQRWVAEIRLPPTSIVMLATIQQDTGQDIIRDMAMREKRKEK